MGVPIRDLIKMREEVRMNPSTEVSTPLEKPKTNVEVPTLNPLAGSTPQKVDYNAENKYRAAMIAKGAPEPVASKPEEQKVSLYEIGKQNAGASNIAKAESIMKNPSPITSPEYEKFREQVIGAQQFGVETPEQAAARERRDFIKQGLTGFTEGLSALANLYYTTKGAPSQKLTSQMPELSKRLYAERLARDKKLENFRAWQRAKAEKDEERAYQEKVAADTRAYNDAIRKEQQEREDKKTKQTQDNWERAFKRDEENKAYDRKIAEEATAYQRTRDAKADALAWARHNLDVKKHEDTMNGKVTGKGSKALKIEPVSTMKGVMDVDYSKINDRNFIQLYNSVPDDIKEKYTFESYDDEKTREFMMNRAISEALETSNEYADKFEQLGIGTYRAPVASSSSQTKSSAGNVDWSKQNDNMSWQPNTTPSKTEGKGGRALGNIGFIKSTKSNEDASPEPAQTEMANVSATQESVEVPTTPPIEEEVPGNKYERMLAKDKRKAEKDREETQKRIDEALAKTAKSVDEAKAKRAELNSILNNELAEFDIEAFIKDNNIGHWDARKFRMEYADDEKKRASIKRQLERLNEFINNR